MAASVCSVRSIPLDIVALGRGIVPGPAVQLRQRLRAGRGYPPPRNTGSAGCPPSGHGAAGSASFQHLRQSAKYPAHAAGLLGQPPQQTAMALPPGPLSGIHGNHAAADLPCDDHLRRRQQGEIGLGVLLPPGQLLQMDIAPGAQRRLTCRQIADIPRRQARTPVPPVSAFPDMLRR